MQVLEPCISVHPLLCVCICLQVMYPYFAQWIRSHRDLPLRLNQWTNVVRLASTTSDKPSSQPSTPCLGMYRSESILAKSLQLDTICMKHIQFPNSSPQPEHKML